VLLVLVVCGTVTPSRAEVKLAELRLERQGTFTSLIIPLPGRVLCNHFIEEPKDGKPFRVVLDLCGAVHQLDQKNFAALPSGIITRIRTSQYATTPQNVVRVVLDLAHEATYKVTADEKAVTVSLVTPGEPEFTPWSSSGTPSAAESIPATAMANPPTRDQSNKPAASTSLVAAAKAPAEPIATAPKPDKKSEPAVSLASNEKNKPPKLEVAHGPAEDNLPAAGTATDVSFKPAATQSSIKPTTETVQPVTQTMPPLLEPQPRSTAKLDGPSPLAVSPMGVSTLPPVAEKVAGSPEPSPAQKEFAAASIEEPKPTAPAPLVPAVRQYDSPAGPAWPGASTPATTAQGGSPTPVAQNAVEKNAPVVSTPFQSKSEVTPAPLPTVTVQKEEKLPLLARLRKKFIGGAGEEKTTVDAHTDSTALARIRALAALAPPPVSSASGDSSMATVGQPRRIDRAELESKIASVDPSAVPPGAALAETEGEPQAEGAEKGSPVQLELSRQEIEYNPGNARDPYAPLVEGQRSGLWTSSLPRVDALRLVGVLQDYDGAIALFEDMEGYGYILREGDPVKDGVLLTIGTNRAVFQINEYGWVHTVALELRKDKSKSKSGYATEAQGP